LGNGTSGEEPNSTPVQIGSDTGWASIAAGDYHSIAVKSDGSLWAWGGNANGQIGDGTTTQRNSPVYITGNVRNNALIAINGGASSTNSTDASLNLNAADDYGVAEMHFNNANENWQSPVQAYAETTSWTLTDGGDGIKTVYGKFKDSAGNWSRVYSDTILLDTIPPEGSITINNDALTTNSMLVTLTLGTVDSGSGVGFMKFSNDGTDWSDEEPYAASKAWLLSPGNGVKTVYVTFRDNAGNLSTSSFLDTIVLDAVAPTIDIISPAEGETNDITPLLQYIVSHGTATVYLDGAITTLHSGDTISSLEDGPHEVKVVAVDDLANQSTAMQQFTVKSILTIDPVTSPTSTNNQTITGTRSIGTTVTVVVNTTAEAGEIAYPASNTWSCPITGLIEGSNIITGSTDTTGQNPVSASIDYSSQAIMTNVGISRNAINTALFETSTIFFSLNSPSSPVTVTFRVKKLDGSLVLEQTKTDCPSVGSCSIEWDGKVSGSPVDDAAYLVTVEASAGGITTTYSPIAASGTANVYCSTGNSFDPYKNQPLTAYYSASQPASVTLSIKDLAEHSIPLLANMALDAGNYTYDWYGRNETGDILTSWSEVVCSGTPLSENVIISTGKTPQISGLSIDPYKISLSYGQFVKSQFEVTTAVSTTVTVKIKTPTGAELTLMNSSITTPGTYSYEVEWPDYKTTSGNQFSVKDEGIYTVTIQAGNASPVQAVLEVEY
jgi:hypothetical protein